MAKARVQMHYLTHDCFLAPGQLLAGFERLRHIPAAIVQGLADPVCPPHVAESLHRAWPEATWGPVPDAGHGGLSPPVARACINALGWVGESVVG
jgi:proline iminopeptidase